MSVNLIYGDLSKNKSAFYIEQIKEIKKNNEESPVVIVVPDQFSYTAERMVIKEFGGAGLNGIEVLTFSRMVSRFLKHSNEKYLSPAGKMILLQKAIIDACKENNVYVGCVDKSGLLTHTEGIISEFKRYMITPEVLKNTYQKLSDGILKQKLKSLAEIYEKYEELNDERFYDSEEDFSYLAKEIQDCRIFSDAYVFFDEFADFLPRHYLVIESIMKNCEELYITLPYERKNLNVMTKIPENTNNRILSLAAKNKMEINYFDVSEDKGFLSSEIDFYFKNFTSFYDRKFLPYKSNTKDIKLFYARDPYSEVENAARCINKLVEKEGMRYSDILLVCGNTEDYAHIIEAVFNDNKIPYFADRKMVITEHPIVITITALFDIINENWSYESVFRFLKSGFIYVSEDDKISRISSDDVDFLECYVLKKGIRGKKKWLSDEDWEYKTLGIADDEKKFKITENDVENTIRINEIRRKITAPIKAFIDATSKKASVKDLSVALFEFLKNIYLYEGLQIEIKDFVNNERLNEAEQFTGVWNYLVEVINQLVITLEEQKVSREEFSKLILAGLSACEISIIPSSLDSVTVSGADSARQKDVGALFVLGAIRGCVPVELSNEGIFTNREREEMSEILESLGYEISKGTNVANDENLYKFYRVLFTAKKKITFSYPLNSFEGEAQIPSQIIADTVKIFPNLKKEDDIIYKKQQDELVYSPKEAFEYLLKNRNKKDDIGYLYDWFSEKTEWQKQLKMLREADFYKKFPASISKESAQMIYENNQVYSVSRLNEFAKCPFGYFAKYGLMARPEEIWQIQKFDLGTIMHMAVYRYCDEVEKGCITFEDARKCWSSLSEKASSEIVDTIMRQLSSEVIQKIERDEAKVKYLLQRMTKSLKRACEVVRLSLSKGEYVIAEKEKRFNIKLDCGDVVIPVCGTVDRIDVMKAEDTKIRVIDYKSGAKEFSVVSLCNMTDIQLVLYAMAAMQLHKEGNLKYSDKNGDAKITGMMYNKIRDDFVRVDIDKVDTVYDKLSKEMKLDGVLILDKNQDDSDLVDLNDAYLMDKDLKESGKSTYLHFDVSKNNPGFYARYYTRESFDKMLKYVKKKLKQTDSRIKNGDISVTPSVEGDSCACEYCDMAEACFFDKDKDTIRKCCNKDDEAWEIIENETKE